jgi:hypothetical protein
MNARAVRGWLLQQPRPAILRLTSGDGEPQELRLGRSFAKTAETIEALDPTLIEALDSEGRLLRATNLREAEVQSGGRAVVPSELAGDPAAAMLTHFANLLATAYQHSTDVAFTKMVELVERMGDRADSIEARLERAEADYRKTVRDQIREALERAEEKANDPDGDGSLLTQMAGAFLGGGAGMAPRPPPAKAKPNGKAEA